jgi:hypothetical protein
MAESDRDRIKSLEALVANQSSEIAVLKSQMKPTATPPRKEQFEEEGVVRTFFPRTTSIEMPSSKQFEQLFEIVERVRPKPVPEFSSDWARHEYIRKCGIAFEYLTHIRRSEGPNERYVFSWWTDNANVSWLRPQGSPSIEGDHLYVAMLMAGDIPYQVQNAQAGKVLAVGLTFNSEGKRASSQGWRSVLERGAPRPPIVPVVQPEHRTVVHVAM